MFYPIRFLFTYLLIIIILLMSMTIWYKWYSSSPKAVTRIPVLHSGQFCVLFDVTRPIKFNYSHPITLAVHSTLHFAHHLHVQAQHWDGPISAAILLRNSEEFAALPNLLALWHCSLLMRRKVSLHLVWRIGPFQQNDCGQLSIDQRAFISAKFSCPKEISPQMVVRPIFGSISWPPLRYPINTLRNIARLGANQNSRFHVVADVENIFSDNFTAIVWEYLRTKNEEVKELLVFRRFELEEGQQIATNLAKLRRQIQLGLAFPFHRHHFYIGHHIPALKEWMDYSLQQNSTVRTTSLKFRNAALEPQFVMPSNAPFHFEGVPARLYDHQVLVSEKVIELCHAGFNLRLLSHVFNVHYGVRRNLNNVEMLIKKIVANQAWKLRREFRQYLEGKYSKQNEQICPNFWDRLNLLPDKKNSTTDKILT